MLAPLKVTCAIIQHKGKILVVQRSTTMPLPGKWEFPGGKIELGESEEDCIIREIMEELNIEIDLGERLPSTVHHYPTRSIELIPFMATLRSGNIHLTEHQHHRFLAKAELETLDWAEADLLVVKTILNTSMQ